jgi:hypothetical protein
MDGQELPERKKFPKSVWYVVITVEKLKNVAQRA